MSSSSETLAPPQPETQKTPDSLAEQGEMPITDEQLKAIVEGDSESLTRGASAVKKLSEGVLRAGSDYGTTTEEAVRVATETGATEELATNDALAEQVVEDFGRGSAAIVAEGTAAPVVDIAESPDSPASSPIWVVTSGEVNPMDIARQASEVVPEAQSEAIAQDTTEAGTEIRGTVEKEQSLSVTERAGEMLRAYSEVRGKIILEQKLARESEKLQRPLTPVETDEITKEVSARIRKTTEYFESVDKERSPETPLARVASIYEGLGDVDKDALEAHMKLVIELAFNQQIDNPEQYCSHGFDHTLSVAEYTKQVAENNSEIISKVQAQYGITEAEAMFLLETVALFHDFGYPTIGQRSKAAHGITGAEIISQDQSLAPLLGSGDRVGLVGVDPDKRDALAHDLRDAVLLHSADKVESHFSVKVVSRKGTFLTSAGNVDEVVSTFTSPDTETGAPSEESTEIYVARGSDMDVLDGIRIAREQSEDPGKPIEVIVVDNGLEVGKWRYGDSEGEPSLITVHVTDEGFEGRSADLHENKDKMIGLEYSEVDIEDEPLQGVIRVADNMDMRRVRLSETQLDPAFQEIYEAFGDMGDHSMALASFEKLEDDWQKLSDEQSGKKDEIKTRVQETLLKLEFSEEQIIAVLTAEDFPRSATEMLKEQIIQSILSQDRYSGYEQPQRDAIEEISMSQNSEAMRHFDGCMAIEGVELSGSMLTVTVDRKAFERLNKFGADEKAAGIIPIGAYQIWRAIQAYGSLTVGKQLINVRVVDQEGEEIELPFTTKA
ncbi:MAG: HD domain-containing protein [bacterium]